MRSPLSKCLLCLENNSDKKNSHIIPKFMSKSVLGTGIRKAYTLDSTDITRKEISQDTPKEDYILCKSCEHYFSVLEDVIARYLHNKVLSGNYSLTIPQAENGIKWLACDWIDQRIFRLFIYSIIYRCHISSHKVFSGFSLSKQTGDEIRSCLLEYKTIRRSELSTNIDSSSRNFLIIPFLLFTASSFTDRTRNFIGFNPFTSNPYQIFLNEYQLTFSLGIDATLLKLKNLYNIDGSIINIGFLPPEIWNENKQKIIEMMIKASYKK